jgi:hypothetical protein
MRKDQGSCVALKVCRQLALKLLASWSTECLERCQPRTHASPYYARRFLQGKLPGYPSNLLKVREQSTASGAIPGVKNNEGACFTVQISF